MSETNRSLFCTPNKAVAMDEENEFSRDVYIETLAHESRNNSQLQTYTNFANTKGGYMK